MSDARENKVMNRRNFMSTTTAFAAAAVTSNLAFAEKLEKNRGKEQDQHMKHETVETSLASVASHCVLKGEGCLQHCMEMLSAGDTSMANCSKVVREMILFCQGLSKAAVQKSKHLKEIAKIAMNACNDCEAECKLHASKHSVCRECAESCSLCIKQCKAIVV